MPALFLSSRLPTTLNYKWARQSRRLLCKKVSIECYRHAVEAAYPRTNTDTHDNSPQVHDRQRSLREAEPSDKHDQVSNARHRETSKQTSPSAKAIRDGTEQDRAHRASQIVHGNNDTNLRILLFNAHGSKVIIVGVDEGHHSLVVAIEGDRRAAESNDLHENII